jgi:hypothetical protein
MPYQPETDDEKRRDPNAPGGYEGFNAYFNANKATSKASADKYAGQAQQSVAGAQQALQKTQNDFNSQLNASQAPTNVGVAAGPRPVSTPGAPGAYGTTTNIGGSAPQPPAPQTPGSLGDISSFQTAADKANAAKETLGQLGLAGFGGLDANGVPRGDLQTLVAKENPGTSRGADLLSANLIGSAGRQQFDALNAQFNPQKDLAEATLKSAAQSKAAQDAAAAAAQAKTTGAGAGAAVAANNPGGALNGLGPPAIPDSVTTVDQAIQAGYSQDQIVAKFGYGAYSDSVGQAMQRGKS